MAVIKNRDRKAVKARLLAFDIDPNKVLEEGVSSRGYYTRSENYWEEKTFHEWPEGFDWEYFRTLLYPQPIEFAREWTRSDIRALIVEVLLEIEIEKVKSRNGNQESR